jgi:Ferredoxin subunits of nitrite reductase and ring-hydroxylating dioxygenases
MSHWIGISTMDQLADGSYERFEFDDLDVLVFREGDSLYAIEDKCTHDSAELLLS